MLRSRWFTAQAVIVGLTVLAGVGRAQHAEPARTVFQLPLPGGLRGALAAIDDRVTPDRSQFLVEFIRRSYPAQIGPKQDPRDAVLRALLSYLDVSSRQPGTGPVETLPLPLAPEVWTDVVFGGRVASQNLLSAILQSRSAALLYHGLLSLDDATRAWLATRRDVIEHLTTHSAAFLLAAPGLRVAGAAVRVPGGELATPAWEALVGRRVTEPADFVRDLLTDGQGRLAYFFGAMAQLTPAQVRVAMNLDSPDVSDRITAGRRLHAIFEHIASSWRIADRAFSRPALDPALLVADLRPGADGRPVVPGTRPFWTAVFAESDQGGNNSRNADLRLFDGEPADLVWLCEQVFKGEQAGQRRRYQLVLFASRMVRHVTAVPARDAIDAVRAAGTYPAMVAVLERAKLVDLGVLARAARRAAQLSSITDDARAARSLAQFQAALALVVRAALRGSLPADSLSGLVSSLCAVELSEQGDYEGRLVRWVDLLLRNASTHTSNGTGMFGELSAELYENAAGPVDLEVFRMLAGPPAAEPRLVEWEGTRYRLDLARGEATRLARLLGEGSRPNLSSARALVDMADALSGPDLTRERLRQQVDVLARVARAVVWDDAEVWDASQRRDVFNRYRELAPALQRLARTGDVQGAARLAPAVRLLGDDLLASGLTEFVYAVAMGHPDRAPISAADASSRHEFGHSGGARRADAWRLPMAGAGGTRGWGVTGSLLGLDVALAEFSLVRLSSRPPLRKPTLADDERRVLTEAVVLVDPTVLSETAHDTVVTAIQKGRARLAEVRTPIEAAAIADEIQLSPIRRTLLEWVVAQDPERVAAFLSPSELLWLGLPKLPVEEIEKLHAWGAPASPRLGCLCLQIIDRRPWETLAGRWNSGMVASAFPDLNLRLAELLTELQMPAPLLGPVLASATLDLINTVTSRDRDDRRALIEFVHGLRADRVEQYLALLTTEGPLVPIGEVGQEPILDLWDTQRR